MSEHVPLTDVELNTLEHGLASIPPVRRRAALEIRSLRSQAETVKRLRKLLGTCMIPVARREDIGGKLLVTGSKSCGSERPCAVHDQEEKA